MSAEAPLLSTPLHALHLELGAKMVPFAGYAMPLQYPAGILAEHSACRESAALFDVSHMGQVRLLGPGAAAALETLVPMDIIGLPLHKQRYALLTQDDAGLMDDLMVVRREEDIFLIVNAACKTADVAHLQAGIGNQCSVLPQPDSALLALQGPKAVAAASGLNAGLAALTFMTGGW